MNRIQKLFRDKPTGILSVFFTGGFPQLGSTLEVSEALATAGVDLIEIGIPFSDPVADGPAIQDSNKVALQNGMNLKLLIDQVKEIRKEISIPIILMGYMNPVLQYGVEKFCLDSANAGVDGIILPDLPVNVFQDEYRELFEQAGLTNTFLISPTTSEERIRVIDELSDSFIYAVSASSTTGAKNDFSIQQIKYFEKLALLKLKNPHLIGFGISNHDTFKTACQFGSGAIVGSAFISVLKTSTNIKTDVDTFVKEIKDGRL
jgi:tryptophan synthase alpha chain